MGLRPTMMIHEKKKKAEPGKEPVLSIPDRRLEAPATLGSNPNDRPSPRLYAPSDAEKTASGVVMNIFLWLLMCAVVATIVFGIYRSFT